MSEPIEARRIVSERPPHYFPTLLFAWIEGIGPHDERGDIPPVLHQKFVDNAGNGFVWIAVPTYVKERG